MGAQVCQQVRHQSEEIQEQFNHSDSHINVTFNNDGNPQAEHSITEHPSLQKKNITKLNSVQIQDEPVNISKDQESLEDPQTPYYRADDSNMQIGVQQNIQLFGRQIEMSEKLNSTVKLVTSQHEEVLLCINSINSRTELREQHSVYSKSHKDDKRKRLLNMNLVEDNLDDYMNYDWKNSSFQLINTQDQHLLRKVGSKPQMSKQKKQY